MRDMIHIMRLGGIRYNLGSADPERAREIGLFLVNEKCGHLHHIAYTDQGVWISEGALHCLKEHKIYE